MRAAVLDGPGGPEAIELKEFPVLDPTGDEVLIAVHAVGLNIVDAFNREDGTWAGLTYPAIPGYDFAGTIAAIGDDVSDWEEGAEVFGLLPFTGNSRGSCAEFCLADSRRIRQLPGSLDFSQAAAVPLASMTAAETLRRPGIQAGDCVLILGAGGGVGTFAVQLAVARGARVVASASSRHHELLHELGAERCIDYKSEDVAITAADGGDVDAILDFAGSPALESALPALREGGSVSAIVDLHGNFDEAMLNNVTFHGILLDAEDSSLLDAVIDEVEAGRVRPIVSETFTLDEITEAHRRLDGGHLSGKLVVNVRQ